MKNSALFFVALLQVLAASGLAGAEPGTAIDWPQWRGIHRDGVSHETGLLDRWPEGGPPTVWSSGAGAGFSGISVVDGRLYTMGDREGAQYLLCIDAMTGVRLWERKLGAAFKNPYGDGPRSTPLVDGDLAFAVGTGGLLLAADRKTGEVAWQHDLVEEFGARLPSSGFASSPLTVGDELILEVGGSGGTFMAFVRQDGRVSWSSQADRTAYSSPIAVTIDGTPQVVFWSGAGLHAVSPRGGGLLWKYRSETLCPVSGDPLNTGTPIFLAPDRLYIASGSGAKMLRIVHSGKQWHPELMWETEQMRSDVNTAVVVGELIYGFNRGILQSIDAKTGEVMWQARGFSRGSLIAADGKLIVFGEGGNLALVEAVPDSFEQLATVQVLDGKNWTAPSLANGYLYLRNHEKLVALNLRQEESGRSENTAAEQGR